MLGHFCMQRGKCVGFLKREKKKKKTSVRFAFEHKAFWSASCQSVGGQHKVMGKKQDPAFVKKFLFFSLAHLVQFRCHVQHSASLRFIKLGQLI